MSQRTIKRFYKAVAVERDRAGDGFAVALDGRPVRTPAKAPLRVPGRALAEAIRAEWADQGEEVDLLAMPLTALACTAIDLVGAKRERIVAEVAAYGGHDLLCYRAEAPADLAARQQAVWQPLLDWAAQTFDAPLQVTAGIVSVAQPPLAVESLERAVAGLNDFDLAALSSAVNVSGSLVIGLAMRAGRLDAARALNAAQLDELYQAERWGEDAESTRRREGVAAELAAAARAFALLRG